MGHGLTWLAVKGVGTAQVLDALGLVEMEEVEGRLGFAEAAVADLPGGWVVVHYLGMEKLGRPEVESAFPRGEVIWGTASGAVMWSGAYGQRDGRRLWSVEHDPDKDPLGFDAEGELPAEFPAVRDGILAKQARYDEEEVDCIFDLPMALTEALCGYDPTRQRITSTFRVVEPRLHGKQGEEQSARIDLNRRLAAAVEAELVPLVEALGFRRASSLPDYPGVTPDTFLRERDGWTDTLTFAPALYGGVAQVGMQFFVRRGAEHRDGDPGVAIVQPPRKSFLEIFTGRKAEPVDEAVARAVGAARALIPALDRHLRERVDHPDIHPARYWDEIKDGRAAQGE